MKYTSIGHNRKPAVGRASVFKWIRQTCLETDFSSNLLHGTEADIDEPVQIQSQLLTSKYLITVRSGSKALLLEANHDEVRIDGCKPFLGSDESACDNKARQRVRSVQRLSIMFLRGKPCTDYARAR